MCCLSLPWPCSLVSLQDRPAMQLYQPGARNRKRMSSGCKGYDCIPVGPSPEPGSEHCFEVVATATGLEKGLEKSKEEPWAGWTFRGSRLFSCSVERWPVGLRDKALKKQTVIFNSVCCSKDEFECCSTFFILLEHEHFYVKSLEHTVLKCCEKDTNSSSHVWWCISRLDSDLRANVSCLIEPLSHVAQCSSCFWRVPVRDAHVWCPSTVCWWTITIPSPGNTTCYPIFVGSPETGSLWWCYLLKMKYNVSRTYRGWM